jgi:hypothetical protein
MVLSGYCNRKLEINRIAAVDPRETYVSVTCSLLRALMASESYSGLWEEHTSVRSPLVVVFEVIHIAD